MAFRLGLAVLILLGIAARSLHMTDMDSRSPDEYSYTTYAAMLVDEGLPAYRAAFTEYNRNKELWAHPSPARFGFVLMTAGVMKVTGNRNARAGAAVSWFFSVLSLGLVAWVGVRFFNRPVALLALFFLAFNFAELAMARRAWQDATFGFLGLVLVALACWITAEPHRRSLWLAFFATGTYCLLIKESGYVAYGLCWLWLAYIAVAEQKSRALVIRLVVAGLATVALALAVLSFLAGGLEPVIQAQKHILIGTAASAYGYYYEGAWYRFFYLLWLVGPLTALMAAAGVGVTILNLAELHDRRAALMAIFVTAVFVCIAAFGPQLQYLRLTSPVDGTYCLLAATGAWATISRARTLLGNEEILTPVLFLGLGWMALHDYGVFARVIVNSGMEDLAGRAIFTVLGR